MKSPLDHVRRLCLAFPEVEERISHGEPAWFVRGKRSFAMFANNHHSDGRIALWCKAPPGAQAGYVQMDPEVFFVPPYLGPRGWVGVRLDLEEEPDLLPVIVEDAYRLAAPRRLLDQLARGRSEKDVE
jgi:hypothetical protein